MKAMAIAVLATVMIAQTICTEHVHRDMGQTEHQNAPTEEKDATVLARWRAVLPDDVGGYSRYLKELAQNRDFESLKVVYSSDIPYASWAAQEAALAIGPAKVVSFCEVFEPGSLNWQASFVALGHYENGVGMGYIKRMAASPKPFVRCWCYRLCLQKGWNGLTEFAVRDLGDRSAFLLPNSDYPLVLGALAKEYLQTFSGSSADRRIPQISYAFVDDPMAGAAPSDLILVMRPNSSLCDWQGVCVREDDLNVLLASPKRAELTVRIVLADEEHTFAPDIFKTACMVAKHASPLKWTRIISLFKL